MPPCSHISFSMSERWSSKLTELQLAKNKCFKVQNCDGSALVTDCSMVTMTSERWMRSFPLSIFTEVHRDETELSTTDIVIYWILKQLWKDMEKSQSKWCYCNSDMIEPGFHLPESIGNCSLAMKILFYKLNC